MAATLSILATPMTALAAPAGAAVPGVPTITGVSGGDHALAVGWGAGQLKVGSFTRSERMAKWNETLRVEEAIGSKARYAGGSMLGRSK